MGTKCVGSPLNQVYPAWDMTFSIFDSGNLVASFDQIDAAHEALERLAAANADSTERLLLVELSADGEIVADYAPGERVSHVA